jgi:hypothetical protein
MMIEWPKVYFGKNGWTFTAVLDGKLIERNISEYHAMGLAESVLAASKRKADPDPEEGGIPAAWRAA